jgi:hypothetical protein
MDTAEFDRFADEYDQLLAKHITASGEKPEFFHEYKVSALSRLARERKLLTESILGFGSGIGNSHSFFSAVFPGRPPGRCGCFAAQPGARGGALPGMSTGLRIENQRIPAKDDSFAMSFSACVFHHIPHEEHVYWLRELRRVTRPVGCWESSSTTA